MLRLETKRAHNQISQKPVSVRDLAVDAEVGGNGDGGDDETVKRSPLSKKPNGRTEYLISLRSDADSVPFEKRSAHLIILIIVEAPR